MVGGDQEMCEVGLDILSGQAAKDEMDLFGESRVGGHQPVVGIHTSGLFIEVARGKQRIQPARTTFLTSDQAQLGMYFDAPRAVEHTDAGVTLTEDWEVLLRRLTKYYVGTRYPEEVSMLGGEATKDLASQALLRTKEFFQWLGKPQT